MILSLALHELRYQPMTRLGSAAGAAALGVLLAGCGAVSRPTVSPPTVSPPAVSQSPSVDHVALIEELTAGLSATGFYRDPTAKERSQAREAVRALLRDSSDTAVIDAAFGELGFRQVHGIDPATGRPYSLFITRKDASTPWGVVLVDGSTAPQVVIEVPHPGFDLNTDALGVQAQRLTPGTVLLIAGTHRQAGGGSGDVAHNDQSMFHVLATEFASTGLPQVQLHGFADQNLAGVDAVVSTGSAPVTRGARELATALETAGLMTCRAWAQRCGQLEGTTNVQGQAAGELSSPFIHLELSWSVRGDESRRLAVAKAISGLYLAR